MNKRPLVISFTLSLACMMTNLATGQGLGFASPESVGLSASKLDEATASLQQHIDAGDIAGVVAAVARDGKIVYFESLGMMNIEQAKPMQEDALFRIYSMTREITSLAVLQLYEQGKFKMDDPIKMYLPDFEAQRVLLDLSLIHI